MAHLEQDEKTGKLKWIRDEEDTPGWIKNMASSSNNVWRAVEDWFNSSVSKQQKEQWWIKGSLYRAADSINNVAWSIIWETISAFWNAPKFFTDAIDSAYFDNVNWWWSDLRKEADKKQDEWASWLSAWTDTVAENSNTEWADNQSLAWETVNQAINWPLLWIVWKWINLWSKWIRWLWNWLTKLTTHWDDVVKVTPKFWNIIDDAIKWGTKTSEEIFEWTTKIWWRTDEISDTSKMFSNVNDVAEAWAKWTVNIWSKQPTALEFLDNIINDSTKAVENVAAKNPSVLSKVWNWTKNTLKKTWNEASPFILWPIKSASDIATAWLKAWYNTYRASWIWAGVIEWITTTMEKSLNFASDFATKPLSFRTPAIWEAKMSSDITWEWYWVYDKNRDLKNFYDDHWYSLEEANAYKDDEALTAWYDKRNIDEDKRLTKAEVEQMLSEVWKNKFTDTMTSWYNSLTLFDPFTSPNLIASSRAWENVEAEKNPRWETIWFVELSDWTTADFSDLDNIIVKDKDWNDLSPEDLTEENIIELESFIKESFWSFDEEEQTQQDDQTIWWDNDNILMTQLNSWSTDWMINADTMSEIVNWKNTWSHDVWIATKLQEWTKQYASNIIALYTKDALEKDPQLQREVVNSLNAYSKLFNWTIDIINNLDEKDYEKDVYEFRKALTESYNNLSAADKDLINANLYQKAIDYNNWLESGIDEWLMKTATWWKRAVDSAFDLIKSDDRTMWYDQWLQWLWSTLINPDTRWWSSMMNDVWTHLEAQEATIATTLIANRINNSVIEKIPAKWIDAVIKKNPELNTKWMTFIKWATSEMASEPLENFIDQVSLVDSSDHDYDYWNWLLFGMFQWWLAWYAWSRNSYSSVNDYFSKPENRKTILENMWIYIDQIKDDQQRAVALSITNQMFDSVVDIMKQVTAETNNWVEAIMQWFAIYQTESMLWDYAVWVIWQMIDAVNARDKALWWNWTENDILWMFETVNDFNNYNAGKSFNFSQSFVDAIRNSRENTEKLNQIRNVATAYINSSFKTAWMSLEDWINFMAPKIYEASGKKVSIPLFNKKISDNQIVDQLTWDKYFDIVTIYAWTNQIAPTIWEKMWITKNNDLVYWEHKRVADIKWVPLKYNSFLKITTKTKWYRPTVKLDSWEEISMRDYIIRQLNDPNTNLTDDERMFISTILFKTTVSWYNHYFNDDGSLSRLWEDFFEQVLPQLEWLNTPKKLFDKLSSIQRLKEAESETSERKALQESKANENQVEVLRLEWWTNVKNWDDITDLPDSQPLPIENNWQQVFVKDLRDAWSLEVKDWNTKYTYTVDRDWQSETLSITKKESSDSLYWMSQWIIYSEDQEIQNQYEAYMNRWFFNSTIPQSLEKEYVWDNPSNEYNDMRIRELKSKIEKKLNKTSFWSWEARRMASWLQELNIRLAHQQQVAQEQEGWYVMKKWWVWTTTITDNDVSTREVNVPISAKASDYPELKEWEFREAYELVAAQDAAKKKIPYLDQTKITVWIEDWAQWIESFNATKADIKKQSGEINSESYWKTLPVVEIEAKDDDWNNITKRYRAVRIWDSSIKDWNNSKGKNRDFIFKSFVLVDFENWESVNKYSTKAIRPSKYPKDYVFYSDNNIVIEVLWADKKPLNENRVVMFTKWNKKWEDRQVWRMSTTVQYDRLSEHDQDIAVSKSRIFMNESNSDPKTRTKWYLWPQEIVYDARYIYTTSDIVFNDHNLRFRMWDVSVDLSTKNYNAEKLSRQLNEQDSEWLQKQLKTIWKLTQTISSDWAIEQSTPTSTTDEIVENIEPVSEKSTPQEVKNELRTVDKTVEQQYNYWLEKAKADDANPTKSVAESAMDNTAVLVSEWELLTQAPEWIKTIQTTQSELDYIKAEAIRNWTFMKAPNWKPSNLSEANWLQVRTKDFKEWFWDWENDPKNASKVVDENWEPLLVYHGGARWIERFRLPTSWEESNTWYWTYTDRKTWEVIPIDSNRTIFFSNNYFVARYYSDLRAQNELWISSDDDITERDRWLHSFNVAREFINNNNNNEWLDKLISWEIPESLLNYINNQYKSGWHWDSDGRAVVWDIINVWDDLSETNEFWRPVNEIYFEYYSTSWLSIIWKWKYEKYSWNLKWYDKGKLKEAFDIMQKINSDTMKSDIDKLRSVYKDQWQIYSAFLNIRDPLSHDYEWSWIWIWWNYKWKKYQTWYINARQVDKAIKEWKDWVIYENIKDPNIANNYWVFDPDNIRFASQQITDNDILVQNTQELEAIVDQTPVAALPSPSELLEQTSAPNEVIASNYLSTDDKITELADDCKKLHITLDALSPQQLAVVIQAYEQWLWINYVIEQFSKDLLTSKVDYKLVDALTKKWILRKDVEYDWLTISQMINYTALINDQNKKNIYAMINPNELNSKTWRSVVDEITKYYIRNYFNYNPYTIDSKLKSRIREMVEEKLLDSDIFVAEKWNTTLDVDSDLQTILSIESLNPELKKTFAQSAYNLWLISATRYNYLMWSNPYITNIDNGNYNPWIIASTIISSMNKIPEFAAFESDTANQNKIQLIWDVYNYFSIVSRWSTYEWLIKYLKRIHKWSSIEMKNMIAVLENDQKETANLVHSEEVMNVFWWNSTTYQNSPYENFIKDKWDNEDAIIEALIELEKDDVPSFLQIIKTAPWDIRRPIYQRFYQDNKLNHWKNLAYWLVSMLLNNYKEVEEALKDEKKSKTLSDDALYLLRNFDRRSLINPLVTQQLIKELWIRWLDPNLWTVILTDNYQDSLWRWMKNFDNVKRFELLPVSSLSSIKMNVNVIVPKWVSIPKIKEWTFNIVRYNEAWYKNWAMVVRTYDWSEYNMTDRVFNIIWMNWFRVEYRQWWLDRSQRQIVIDNKENKSLYWNIFKYNIMPNLWLDQQDIKQEEFEAVIDPNRMKDVRNTTLYNAFTARNINELVDASVKLINHITNWQLWLTSNLEWWRKSVAVKPAIDSFVAFVKREFNTSTQRELVLNAFSEYLMMQLKLENTDRWQRFHDFCERHDAAIRLLADKYKDRSERWWNISDLFVNIDQLIERSTSPLEEYNVDKSIATEEDLKVIADVNKKIKDARKLAREKEAAYHATDWKTSTPEERAVRAKLYREWQNALDDIEDLIVDRDEMYESTMTSDQEAMQEELIDVDQANNSSVVTSQYETLWAYEDKAVKVLNAIFTDYIKPNEISAWDSTPDKIRNTKLVSKWLLDIVTWRDLFSTQNTLTEDMSKKDVNEFFSSNRRLDISNQDLMALQWMLVTLKETNPKKLREIVDMIIVTQDEIWNEYINNVANNEKLKRAKRLLYNDPTQLYNIMNELLNDSTLWLDVYYWVKYEKSDKYKWINLNWLLNNIAQEYYNTRPKTATSENIWQLHEVYDKYFEIKVDWKDVKPSDEQVNALSNLIDMYENRTSWWTLSIPGIAWTWKTTLLTAFFNYIMERWWAAQEVDNIAWKKQTVFINNFSPANSKLLDKIIWDNNDHYIRVYNKESWGDVYIKFKWSALVPHYILEGRYNESKDKEWFLSKLSERFWWLRSNEWLMAIAEIWNNKYKDSWSKYTWMINNFEVVSKDDIPSWIKVMDIPWKQQKISARKWQSYWEISNNAEWLNDISFAVRMHSTVWSLKDVFVSQWWLAWLDIATIDSYLIQENKPLINDFWYETSYNIRPDRNTEWRVIIIDEAQNTYNTHLQALVDQLSEKNVIVFLWDYHQMSKWDYLKRNNNWSLYMIETHRWTDDINLVNDISSFTQQSLIDANAIWLYLTDSEDFVKYNNEDLRNLMPNDVKKTLMVCSKNVNRQAMNDMYIEQLWWMANITSNKNWKTIQAMIVDIESSERSQRNRKSEIPNEWLDMRWFKKYQWWNWYYKYNWNWIDIFFPSTRQTDVSDSEIASALSTVRWWTNKKTGKKYWKQEDWSYGWDISLYVPAFAITTEKESWKTVDNIILHEDITNTEYDFLSDKNVKQYYDAFTRWAKKVYLPQRSSRLIWITKQQAQDLRDWKWLTSATITNQQESISESVINIPSINNWSWNSSRTIDDMLDVIVNYFSVLNLPISDLIDELKDLWDIMNWMYLQSALTSADVEAIDKHWIWNNIQYINYQRQLQYRAAEIWDKIFNMISWNKNNIQVLNAAYWFDDNFLNKLESINWKVYWQTTKTPYIERKNSDKKLLYWQKKYANKKLDVQMINSLLADASSVAEWSLLEWTLYRPITKQDASWKFYTTLQSVKVNRDTKTKRWWINFWNDWARSAEAYDAMVRRINNDFTLAINEDNFEWTEEEFEQVRNEEIEKIFDNVDSEIWKISMFIQDNDLESVKDIIASNSSNEEYMSSQLQNMLDAVIELAQDRNYDDIDEIKNLIIELNWYLISYDNWETTLWEIEWMLNTWEVAFNVSSAQDTINQEFTCE